MEQLDPLGNKFHNQKTRGASFDKFKNGVNQTRPQVPTGYQAFGPNPVKWERERAPGFRPPRDDYSYKGPTKIGGAQPTTRNLQQQIEGLVEVLCVDEANGRLEAENARLDLEIEARRRELQALESPKLN